MYQGVHPRACRYLLDPVEDVSRQHTEQEGQPGIEKERHDGHVRKGQQKEYDDIHVGVIYPHALVAQILPYCGGLEMNIKAQQCKTQSGRQFIEREVEAGERNAKGYQAEAVKP